jgi:hypothetical protein
VDGGGKSPSDEVDPGLLAGRALNYIADRTPQRAGAAAAGLTQHERRGEGHVGRWATALHRAGNVGHREAPEASDRLPYGGERGFGKARVSSVIEADNGDVARAAEAFLPERFERPARHIVVRRYDRVESSRTLE